MTYEFNPFVVGKSYEISESAKAILGCIDVQNKHLIRKGILNFNLTKLLDYSILEKLEQLEVESTKKMSGSPNTMHKYGSENVISELEFKDIFSKVEAFIFEFYGLDLSKDFSIYTNFSVHYSKNRDKKLSKHIDDSDITVNICLENTLEDECSLIFYGSSSSTISYRTQESTTLVNFKKGDMLIHRGSHIHETKSLEDGDGDGCNIIIWLKLK